MIYRFLFALLLSFSIPLQADHNQVQFKGEFSQVNAPEGPCLEVFKQKQYKTKFFLTGASGRTAVLYLESTSEGGGLHRVNQIGLYGFNNDFEVEREYKIGDQKFRLLATGIIGPRFILFDQSVKILSNDGKEICRGEAEFSGFNGVRTP